ncbi:Voltage-dependent T-type calcium channel subunit alpha-1H [Bulinus truncatus]|nr:Voltage-dependent T-type calcium channel subunit alpha-1H [Bulinus truncatus]
MFVIILNCVTLGMYQPCNDVQCLTPRCRLLEGFDHFIFAFFALELVIKMIAMGVMGKETYLADSWNRLDCFIVVAGTIEYAIDTENLSLSAIRTIRVLRPLRAINRIPSMRILVMLLLDTLPMLGNVLLLCFFVFFIFGIIGVQMWSGVLRHRCYLDVPGNVTVPEYVTPYYKPPKNEYICSPLSDSGISKCRDLPPYVYEGFTCNASVRNDSLNINTNGSACVNWNQYYTKCLNRAVNPFQGAVSFDNIGLAWVAIFQVISLESWVNIMYYVQDAHSFWDFIYFVALIVIGSFFMINLCLVVIATQFSETKKRETERMMQERKRFQSCSTLASNSEPAGCYAELLKLVAQLYRRVKRKLIKTYYKTRGLQKINPEKSLSLRRKKSKKKGTKKLKSQLTQQQQCSSVAHPSSQPPPPPPVHHHQHVHLVPSLSPQQTQHFHHHINLVTPDIRYQSPPRPSSTPQAPRASPEQSDIDSMSSPRRPNYLVLPSNNYSLNPSSESLAMSHLSIDPFTPVLFKSQQNSPNHLTANFGFAFPILLSRASSYNSRTSIPGKILPSLPEVLAAQGAKNAALAASNLLLNVDYEHSKTQYVADKGLFADNLLMDIVGDKQLTTQMSMQSETDVLQLGSGQSQIDQDPASCGGSTGDKELAGPHVTSSYNPTSIIIAGGDAADSELDMSKDESGVSIRSKFLNCMQKRLKTFVESNLFQRSILVAILLNTLSMGVEYHNQPDELTTVLEYSNIVFCVLFGTEMAFKICAYGLFGYISNGFNVFDGFIVILSIVELAQGGASGLSVLRTFRLLRILKLVRFMPALRRQLVVMLRTMDNVATFFALLVLFMFIFSILGMSLFGGTFCEKENGDRCSCEERLNASLCKCDRANFDNLLWSLVTVFQVLTQEDWNTVLYNGMAKTSEWASLYFVALMTFGNYVLFNLLVAILVEGFSTEDEEKKKEKMKELEAADKDEEEDDEEKEKLRLAENNNIDDVQSTKSCLNSVDLDVKNNKEKEKKMLALPPSSAPTIKTDSPPHSQALLSGDGPLNPPIITHTAATPMATPQGSPNENAIKDTNNKLSVSVKRSALKSTLSVDSDKSPSFRGGSPRPSPCLRRTNSRGSHHQRTASWRARNRRLRGDKTSLVVDSLSDSADEVEDDVFSSSHSQSPTYSAGTPRTPSVNTHGDCNGHPPLNNQRALSPQSSLKGRALTPRNSFKSHHTWSRNNSVGSGRSICNSFELSRQNSFTSHRTVNSLGSGNSKDDKSNKNYVDLPDVKIALDKEEGREDEADEADPDAIDETEWNCSWCPEPKGCFLERHEYAFYLLSNENKLRKFAHHLISRKWFDNTVLFFIALNCITLAMERPDIPPDSIERNFLTYTNYIFTLVFSIEMMIKVIAKGFFIGKHAYLKSGWNVMDGFLVIISLIDIFISMSASSSPKIFGILRVFRLLRTLRPLRVISRAPGLKLVVQTLLSSLRPIGNIVLICCTFFIIFGILGVQLFKGTFYYCKGLNISHVTNRTQCEADKKNQWVNQKYNFDNLGQALMALFVLASKDGWVQIMYTGLDAVDVDQQPIENYNEWRLIYFISFLLLVAFFVLNMFVGVVVENFHKCRESQEIEERAKRAAKRQEKLDKKRKSEGPKALSEMREPPYWANYSHSRLLIHTVISSKYFDLAIAAVIGLNVITMAMEYYMMPQELEFALKIFNFFFTSVFILEALMKIVALGFLRYIKDRWNQLDMLIVILSIVGIVLEEMTNLIIPINPTIIRVMRVLRIARVLKLLKMAKGIRALLDTVIQALPQVGNLGLLFFLLFFIFAALGVELFGRLECDREHPCEGLGVHAHFHNFGMAFLTLFRVATGDNWNGIMKDTLREDCNRNDNCLVNCCVSPLIAPVYFVVFVLMAQFVLVNVVVAVLMKHLEETYKYKELDDELEDELRAEMCALALAGKAGPDGIEIKESHRMMDDETILLRDALITITKASDNPESKESGLEDDNPGGLNVSTLPSFTFSVRPPSEEQSRSEDAATGLSPVNASVTIEGMGSSWSSMDSNRLAVTPSMTGSSPSSERSVRISSPPIKRAHSPYLLTLQGSSGSIQRRPLVKQYSMDVGSDPQLNNLNASMPDVWDKFVDAQKSVSKTDSGISRSQPSLKDMKNGSLDGKTGGSLDSKDGSVPGERLPARDRIKHRLLRSRSSGAKYSRFRDKYKQSNLNKVVHQNSSEAASKELVRRSTLTGSNETGSDVDESMCSDWGSEEAACDLEVKMITGGAEDEEDEIHPTLSQYISEDRDSSQLATSRTLVDSAASSFVSTPRGESKVIKAPYPKCKSPLPPSLQSPRSNPGIDNSSFELGEDTRIPPCCKARETVVVRRSNSFSSSKLVPKAFSPPRAVSPRSDRSLSPYSFREHTTSVSPLALPPSPLALEDSAYKLRNADGSVSPLPYAHSHMLTVPLPHSLYPNPHIRSPSPTPPKCVHLVPPSVDCPYTGKRQTKGSPAPVRRQQTFSRSSAVDHESFVPAGSSPLRCRIPHTLSMDSAFLIPPGISQSYSINDPYVELHAGCRATSPLPSPRNSQQTLPGMFTRSASPQPPLITIPAQQPSQSCHHLVPQPADSTLFPNVSVIYSPSDRDQNNLSIVVPTGNVNSNYNSSSDKNDLHSSTCTSPVLDQNDASIQALGNEDKDNETNNQDQLTEKHEDNL